MTESQLRADTESETPVKGDGLESDDELNSSLTKTKTNKAESVSLLEGKDKSRAAR
jgi:hypothetical protein